MNPRIEHSALVIIGVGIAAFVVAMLVLEGCKATLPEEPAWVETVAANRRDH